MLLLLLSRFSCVWPWDPIDGSPPGSPIPGILQARTLEGVAIFFSNAWKWKVKTKSLSRVWHSRPHGLQPTRLLHPWDFPGKSTGVGCHCLLLRTCELNIKCFQFISVQFSHSVVFDSLWPHGLQHNRLPCPSPTPRARSNSCPSSQWCHLTILSSVVPFSSCLQSFPASGSFSRSQFFA